MLFTIYSFNKYFYIKYLKYLNYKWTEKNTIICFNLFVNSYDL